MIRMSIGGDGYSLGFQCEGVSLNRCVSGRCSVVGHYGARQGESFLGRKWLIGKKIKKELDKPEGISHAKMV